MHEIVFIYLFNHLDLVSDGCSTLPVTNVVHTNLQYETNSYEQRNKSEKTWYRYGDWCSCNGHQYPKRSWRVAELKYWGHMA